jgi:chemotaxis protein MotB
MLLVSRRRRGVDIWPGFVDALSALLMVVIFVLLLFSVGQYLLTDALMGRDKALDSLRGRIAELANVLSLERKESAELQTRVATLGDRLSAMTTERDDFAAQLQGMTLRAEEADTLSQRLRADLDSARSDLEGTRTRLSEAELELTQRRAAIGALEVQRDELQQNLQASRQATAEQEQLTAEAQSRVDALNAQLAELNRQLAQVNAALDASESQVADQRVQIEDLGQRLNVALAQKVEELERYRSEFFGKLREALKDNPDIRIEGDRFVLPSEVLFSSASAELDAEGRREIATVAKELAKIASEIPPELDWVLRVDGHTDRRPIRVAFPSNWELSSARAISIVKFLISEGIDPDHLVAAGFGEYHPIDPGDSEAAFRRNRRIELKLTSR